MFIIAEDDSIDEQFCWSLRQSPDCPILPKRAIITDSTPLSKS